jgi:hypothetical protein
MPEPYKSWQRQENFTFRALWLSKTDKRLQLSKELALTALVQGKVIPSLIKMELELPKFNKREGWHHYFILEAFKVLETFPTLVKHIRSFLKTSDLSAGPLETIFRNRATPVILTKAQRLDLTDRFVKLIENHPFKEKGREFVEFIEPFKEYALALSVERTNFRRWIDGDFNAEDNPIKSLVGEVCTVKTIAFEAPEKEKPQQVAEGVLELSGNTVRVADWEQTFNENDEIFESVAFYEVNIASDTLQTTFFIKAIHRNEDDE